MPLTDTRDLFAKALKGKYAIGAFNVHNMEVLQAVVEACEEEKAPVILQFTKAAREYAHPIYLKKLIEAAVSLSTIPIAIHLDYGDSFELCKECIDEGFTSVMINGTHEPFQKNVEACHKLVEYAHKHNCVVEGALIAGPSTPSSTETKGETASLPMPEPEHAVEFVKRTGVDSLAVDIGNAYGPYKQKHGLRLDTDHLERIKQALTDAGLEELPLVLHGASSVPGELLEEINQNGGALGDGIGGLPDTDVEICRRLGCTKVNVDTDIRLAMTAGIRHGLAESPDEIDPKAFLGRGKSRVKELVRHKVRNVLCSGGHGFDA